MSTKKSLWIRFVTALFCASGCAVSSTEEADDTYIEDEATDPIDGVDVADPIVYTEVQLEEPIAALSNESEEEGDEGIGSHDGDRNPDPTPWTGHEGDGEREDENPDPTPYSASSLSDTKEPDPQPWTHDH